MNFFGKKFCNAAERGFNSFSGIIQIPPNLVVNKKQIPLSLAVIFDHDRILN